MSFTEFETGFNEGGFSDEELSDWSEFNKGNYPEELEGQGLEVVGERVLVSLRTTYSGRPRCFTLPEKELDNEQDYQRKDSVLLSPSTLRQGRKLLPGRAGSETGPSR
ncbi:hypothetical protein KGY64_02955 [Candidatus Bipolaricaulota bacterium]|nr:hypothetical protein [Candidatus Bipolaricaulota bacterium]